MIDGPEQVRASFVIVQDTFVSAGRPRVRITKPLEYLLSPAAALSAAQTLATLNPARRFRLMRVEPGSTEPRLVWDSHPAS